MRSNVEALEQGWMSVSVGASPPQDIPWMDARYLYHHAKTLYRQMKKRFVVTSANFSYHGLCISLEAGITIADHDDVTYFVQAL